jgi:hypothetical protein
MFFESSKIIEYHSKGVKMTQNRSKAWAIELGWRQYIVDETKWPGRVKCCFETFSHAGRFRYHVTTRHVKNIQSHHLPPTQAALKKHIQRAKASIWEKALEANPNICNPNGVGWHVENDRLTIDWTDQAPAPDAVLEIVSCNCKTSKCKTQRCTCLRGETNFDLSTLPLRHFVTRTQTTTQG